MAVTLPLDFFSEAELREKVAKDLTIKQWGKDVSTGKIIVRRQWKFYAFDRETKTITVPRVYARAVFSGREGLSEGAWKTVAFPPLLPSLSLSPSQRIAYDKALFSLKRTGGAIIDLPPGSGKTVIGMELARELSLLTVIVVPRTVLLDQWKRTWEKMFDPKTQKDDKDATQENRKSPKLPKSPKSPEPPNSKKPKTQQPPPTDQKNDICFVPCEPFTIPPTTKVVLCMDSRVQFITNIHLVGFVIFDEGHILSTPSRVDAILRFKPKFTLVQTATLVRDDGTHKMMKLIAELGYRTNANRIVETQKPKHKFRVVLSETGRYHPQKTNPWTQKLDFSSLLLDMAKDEETNRQIVAIAERERDEGRKVLILSSYIEHVEQLSRLFRDSSNVGLLTSKHKVDKDKPFDFLIGTVPKIGTGFDFSTFFSLVDLSVKTLILTHTVKKWQLFEQLIGRVLLRGDPTMETRIFIVLPENPVFHRHISGLKEWILANGGDIVREVLEKDGDEDE